MLPLTVSVPAPSVTAVVGPCSDAGGCGATKRSPATVWLKPLRFRLKSKLPAAAPRLTTVVAGRALFDPRVRVPKASVPPVMVAAAPPGWTKTLPPEIVRVLLTVRAEVGLRVRPAMVLLSAAAPVVQLLALIRTVAVFGVLTGAEFWMTWLA